MADSNFEKTKRQIAEASIAITSMLNSTYAKYYKPELTNGLKDMRKSLVDALNTANKVEKLILGK